MRRVENPVKLQEAYSQVRYKCKCGHSVIILNDKDKVLCKWCGNLVFKDKKTEMLYRINEINKRSKNG